MKIPKRIPNTYQYSFIVGSALRYALHRHSYATGLTARYIQDHWKYLDEEARHNIIRDLRTHIETVGEEWRKDSLKSIDLRIWQELLEWANIAIQPKPIVAPTKYPRIDAIPPELCTTEEAMAILDLKAIGSLRSNRFKKLRFTIVCHNGRQKKLYNRKEIESYRYDPPPAGYVSTREAKSILGYSEKYADSYATSYLKKHNAPHVLVKAHHSYYAWEEDTVRHIAKLRHENRHH